MEPFPVDIDPKQIVHWVLAEHRVSPSSLKTLARRTTEVRQIPARADLHLGDEEREDLSEVATTATLEIAPAHASDGWLLIVVVENEAGPHISGKGAAVEQEQEIDLGAFYRELIRPGSGTANVTAEVEDPEAKARVTHLLDLIERDYHGPPSRS